MTSVSAVVLTVLSFSAATSAPADWPGFRNASRDNKSPDTNLAERWPEDGPARRWTATGLGEGYSSVSVVGNRIYTMGNVDGAEHILALDRATGDIVWKTRNGNEYHDGTGNGPRGTPTVSNGRVYALGGNGDLTCADAETGNVFWKTNILEQFDGSNIVWGISESVLVDEGKVICTPGGSRGSVVALNAETGRPVWVSRIPENPQAGYASPVIAQVGRVKQYVVFTSKGIAGIRASDGRPMWGQNKSSNSTANCATPLVVGDQIFSSSDYGTGAELVQLSSRGNMTAARPVYHTREMKNHHGGMVHLDGFVYGSNSSLLSCVELRTGRATWKQRGMKGSVVYADGKILFRNESGEVVWFRANPRQFEQLGRFRQPDRSKRPAWAHPVILDGTLYLRDMDKLLTYDLR